MPSGRANNIKSQKTEPNWILDVKNVNPRSGLHTINDFGDSIIHFRPRKCISCSLKFEELVLNYTFCIYNVDSHLIPLFANELPVLRLTSVRCAINFCSVGPQAIVLSKQHVQTNKIKSFDSFLYYFIKLWRLPRFYFSEDVFEIWWHVLRDFPKLEKLSLVQNSIWVLVAKRPMLLSCVQD